MARKNRAVAPSMAILRRASPTDPEIPGLRCVVEKTYGRLARLCTNAAEKGRLSPLGNTMHQRIYPDLSGVVHQDFGVTLEYSSTLETGAPQVMAHSEVLQNIRWLDVIVAATVTRINDDVGAYGPRADEFGQAEDGPLKKSKLRHVTIRYD
jgi:hypothetical protein